MDWGGSGPPLVLLGCYLTAHAYDAFAPKLTNQFPEHVHRELLFNNLAGVEARFSCFLDLDQWQFSCQRRVWSHRRTS
jgi:hypothetical protein